MNVKIFKFVGEPGEKLHYEDVKHVAFGLDFSGGAEVEVTNPAVIEKLSNNSHYKLVGGQSSTAGTGTLPKAKTPSQMNKTELAAHAAGLGFELDQSKTKPQMLNQLADLIKKAEADGKDD